MQWSEHELQKNVMVAEIRIVCAGNEQKIVLQNLLFFVLSVDTMFLKVIWKIAFFKIV